VERVGKDVEPHTGASLSLVLFADGGAQRLFAYLRGGIFCSLVTKTEPQFSAPKLATQDPISVRAWIVEIGQRRSRKIFLIGNCAWRPKVGSLTASRLGKVGEMTTQGLPEAEQVRSLSGCAHLAAKLPAAPRVRFP